MRRLLWVVFSLAAPCLYCSRPVENTSFSDRTASPAPRSANSQILPPRIEPFSYAVAAVNNRVFLGRGRELIVIELNAQAQPKLLGRTQLGGEVRDIAVDGDHVFVAVRGSGLSVVDCTVPDSPGQMALFRLPLAEGVDVFEDKAYVAARTGGLRVLDVQDPAVPRELGSYQTSEAALKVEVQGPLLYVASSYAGMRILDVKDPGRISEIGFATRGSYGQGAAWDVTVNGNRAYSAIPDNGLRQVDVGKPTEAETLILYRELYAPVAVVVQGRHVFVADQAAGLRVIGVGQESMREVARLSLDDPVMDLALAGKRLLLALKTRGLAVVDVRHPSSPRLEAALVVPD